MDDAAYHAWLLDAFRDSEEATQRARDDAQLNVDYYDGKQMSEQVVRELKRRGQPAIVFNVIRPKIDYLQGLERTQRTKPRAMPRMPNDEDLAHAATDALRFVCDANNYDDKRSRVWGDMLKVGWGGHEITAEPTAERRYPAGASASPEGLMGSSSMTPPAPAGPIYDIKIRRCQWDRMVWDPFSREDDFSDARYLGMVVWMDRDEAIRKYGEAAADVFDATISASICSTYSDRPAEAWVRHGNRERIRVVLLYHVAEDGEWDFCEFTRGGILRDGPSPWLDEDGRRQHPYAWRSAYIDTDNDRYGLIRDMRPVQDEINHRRSKALHHFTVRQTYGRQGSLGDKSVKDLRHELARPDGHIELAGNVEWGKDFGTIPTNDQSAGQMQLLGEAQAFFATLGPNAAMQGTQVGAPSGRSLQVSQQGGSVQIGTLSDSLRQMDFDCYAKVWDRVRQFWTEETWIRVTDDLNNLRFVGLNRTVPHPMGGFIVDNDVTTLAVDIIIDEQPSNGTMPDEQFAMLVQLKQMDQGNAIPFSDIVNAAPNLRDKADIVDRIRQREQQAQQPNPIQVAAAQAKVADVQAGAQLKGAQAQRTIAEIPGIQADDAATAAHKQALTRQVVTDTHGAATSTVLDAMQAAAALQYPLVAPPAGYQVPAPA